jgi:hypothetical protein
MKDRSKTSTTNSCEGHLRIDEFLPDYDFSARHQIRINAPPSVVYDRLLWLDFNDLWLVRILESVRTGKLLTRSRVPTDFSQRLKGTGFVMLAEVPNQELVTGIVGRFWRPDGGRCMDLTADDFVGFGRPGNAKVAWNFSLRADSSGVTVLSTETRTKCFGSARWKFRIYWSLIYPFAGLIRRAILRRVKTEAE